MEMSSHWEETYFAKKNSAPLILVRESILISEEKKYPPALPKLSLRHPISHTKNVSGGGGSNGLLRGLAAGAGEGGGAMLGLFWGRCILGGRGATPGLRWGRCALVAPGEIWGGGGALTRRLALCAGRGGASGLGR